MCTFFQCLKTMLDYRIVGNLGGGGQNIRGSAISWLLLALQVKVGKVVSFVGEIFVL